MMWRIHCSSTNAQDGTSVWVVQTKYAWWQGWGETHEAEGMERFTMEEVSEGKHAEWGQRVADNAYRMSFYADIEGHAP